MSEVERVFGNAKGVNDFFDQLCDLGAHVIIKLNAYPRDVREDANVSSVVEDDFLAALVANMNILGRLGRVVGVECHHRNFNAHDLMD